MKKIDVLDGLCELIVDCPHSTPNWAETGYLVIRNQNIIDDRLNLVNPSFTNEADYLLRIKRAKPKEKDIIITREAPMGRVCLIPPNLLCCLGQRQVLLRANLKIVYPEYLYWALKTPFVQNQILENEGTGATVSNMRIPVLKALKIPRLKTYEEERFIADFLSTFNHKIELNTQTNQTLEQIAQAIFKSWFVDFEPVKAKMQGGNLAAMEAISGKNSEELHRLQTENPTEYQKLWTIADAFPDEIGENSVPVGWENVYLKDVCNIVYGKNLPTTKLKESGYPVFGGNGIIGFYEKFLYEEPHTLISCRGAASGKVMYSQPNSFVTNNSLVIEHSKSFLSYFYIYESLRIQNLVELTSGSAQPQMTIANMNPVQIILPTEKIHNLYTFQVKYFYERIYRNNLENEQLAKIRDELLPKLLNGDLCNAMDN